MNLSNKNFSKQSHPDCLQRASSVEPPTSPGVAGRLRWAFLDDGWLHLLAWGIGALFIPSLTLAVICRMRQTNR